MSDKKVALDGAEAWLRDPLCHGGLLPVREENISNVAARMDYEMPGSTTMQKVFWLDAFLRQFPQNRPDGPLRGKHNVQKLDAAGRLAVANGEKLPEGVHLRKRK